MVYVVKEVFYTLQGEGVNAGRPAVFCRFAGCNLWSGLEKDRATAVCTFCDTQFRYHPSDPDGGKFLTAATLARRVRDEWPANEGRPLVVCTGGEPLLQLDKAAIDAFHEEGMEVAVETNGTIQAPAGIDYLTVSPKSNARVVQLSGTELKLVYPQLLAMPEQFAQLSDFSQYWLQPMDGPRKDENTQLAIQYCLQHPQWRLSVQTHKLVGVR